MADFNDFMLAEYENIAEAHFETGKQASTFYKYYLLILAAPAIISSFIQGDKLALIIQDAKGSYSYQRWLIVVMLLVISTVGFMICQMVIKYQHDSILYARTVNGIRKYFYDQKSLPVSLEDSIRVLPKEITRPDFYSKGYLGFTVSIFGIIDSVFLLASLFIANKGVIRLETILIGFFFLLAHIVFYIASSYAKQQKFK